jgi:hypothetical protein
MISDATTPEQVKRVYRYSRISIVIFLLFQIGGMYVAFKSINSAISGLNLNDLENQLSSGTTNLNELGITEVNLNSFQSFLSGAALSMTSGFWLTIAWAGLKLRKPYSYKAYRVLIVSFYLQVFFFVLSFNSIYSEHKSIFNPGTLGSAMTFFFTTPIFLIARHKNVKRWNQEYTPPLPQMD